MIIAYALVLYAIYRNMSTQILRALWWWRVSCCVQNHLTHQIYTDKSPPKTRQNHCYHKHTITHMVRHHDSTTNSQCCACARYYHQGPKTKQHTVLWPALLHSKLRSYAVCVSLCVSRSSGLCWWFGFGVDGQATRSTGTEELSTSPLSPRHFYQLARAAAATARDAQRDYAAEYTNVCAEL